MRLGGSSGYRLVQEGQDQDTTLGEESVHPSNEGYEIEMNPMSNRQGYSPVMDSSVHQPMPSAPPDEGEFTIKVLCKEKTFIVKGINESSTILEMKQHLVSLTEIPIERQQLIMRGKLLKPDDKTLSSLQVVDKSVVHLFPKPAVTPAPPVAIPIVNGASNSASTSAINVTANPLHRDNTSTPSVATQLENDPQISQTGREVRLWCMILMILSAFTLFNNLSYFGATGNFGNGVLDSIVFILDTICSAGGIYVASMGMKSLRSLEIEDIRQYVHYLGILAAGCIIMRIFWVFDIMFAVEAVVKKTEAEQKAETDNSTDGSNGGADNTDGSNPNPQKLDEDSVTSFTLQAAMIAMIIIYAWVSCYVRARRLQNAVQSYHQVSGSQRTGDQQV